MNTKAKGRRTKKNAIKYLEERGWKVADVEKNNRGGNTDAFGLFDLIAVNVGNVLFVQVKSNRADVHKKFLGFSNNYCSNNMLVTQMVWTDYKGWTIYDYEDGNVLRDKQWGYSNK